MDIVHKKREARLGTACPFVAHSESKVLPKKKVHTFQSYQQPQSYTYSIIQFHIFLFLKKASAAGTNQ